MISRRAFVVFSVGVAGATGSGQQVDRLPEAPFGSERGWTPLLNGKDLSGWHTEGGSRNAATKPDEWFATSGVSHSPNAPEVLTAGTDVGSVVVNGRKTHSMDLVSDRKFGDHELYLEFMVARGSISGVYLHGLYEVQIADSFTATGPVKFSDAGGIPEFSSGGQKFTGGTPPRSNAAKVAGEWQSYRIRFIAPRFDGSGTRLEPARFERVLYNTVLIHENVSCDGPTRSALDIPEAAENPLMLEGEHGPVAFRNIFFRPL